MHLPMTLVGGKGKRHALPNDGRRASAPVGTFFSLANAGPFQ